MTLGIRSSGLRILAAVVCMAGLSAAGLGVAPASSAATGTTVAVDGNSAGRVFDGVGGLSAGASSRLLSDYPPPQRGQILDYLFKPGYGASLQILKVEIGGDTNSTDGTEPSHMRTASAVDCNRGYEWWLMEQAKARNPGIKLYALEWGAAGWVGAGARTVWTSQNIDYILAWLGCARQHGLAINYLGGWNESGFNAAFFEDLRAALDSHGYSDVKLVADDSFGWTVADAMNSDPAFSKAVGIAGNHYPCGYPNGTTCSSTATAQSLGKPLWASEQSNWTGSPQSYDTGAQAMAQEINRGYVDAQLTAFINWAVIWSAYDEFPFPGSGLMLANTPWSGHYVVGKSIWALAHTGQFTEPGWRYLDSASRRLPGGGSVATLRSPDTGDWSSIAETTGASQAQDVTYDISGGLSAGPVHVWATNLNSGDPAQWFNHTTDIQPQNGSFSLTLQPGYLYTLTTTTGQGKGSASPPPARSLPLPYLDSFNGYAAGQTPRFVSDLGGSFQAAPCLPGTGNQAAPPAGGMCLQQNVTAQPVQWDGMDNYPVTVVGDPASWRNYEVSADAILPQPGSVELDGRALGSGSGLSGYHLRISDQGQWSLYKQGPGTAFGSEAGPVTLASGTASFGVGTWHRLGLELRGDEITAFLDHHVLGSVVDNSYQAGQAGLETSAWEPAQFDNLQVRPLPAPGTGPALGALSPDPVQLQAAPASATLATVVTNPGQSTATAVSAKLQLPQGWTATPVSAAPAALQQGQSAPLSWRVSAPASAAPGAYQATATVTYREAGQDWAATSSVPVDLGIIPQDKMTATTDSDQAGYASWCCEPHFAIDGDPATMWHSQFDPYQPLPHEITLDLGGSYHVTGLLYEPRQDGNPNGVITSYAVSVSTDGTNFTQVTTGSWAGDASVKSATFPAQTARYIRLTALAGENGYASAAELNVLGTPGT
ncbi:MAG: discoidin domain-containing protein [Nocardiopsaceae bacterium]|nr:discoidin domain-containing protein [Nocardiopsaceae bacterium]